jgi:hypothetical protein
VDFSQAASKWSLAHRLSSLSAIIFLSVKQAAFENILQLTAEGSRANITLDQGRASKALERKETHDEPCDGTRSTFGQAWRQMHFLRPNTLRQRPGERPWHVQYQGPEGVAMDGIDAGGLFRDSITSFCLELQSPAVPLFTACPNAHNDVGENKEKFLPNSGCTSSIHLSMYAFVGKLMGIAIRGRHTLDLDFPNVIWKPLVGLPLTRADLTAVNSLCFSMWDMVKLIPRPADAKETDPIGDTVRFRTVTSTGKTVELKPGGNDIPVTWANRDEFLRLEEQFRLREFDTQVLAIKKGLATIVPVQLLPLFTPRQLELMVCGAGHIDIAYLKENTTFRAPMTADLPVVTYLFEALESFTQAQRKQFLRFVWGRNRLPYNAADFTQKFQVWDGGRNSNALPITHTCFFSIELPHYTSVEQLRTKILFAITNCVSIALS